MTPTTSAVKTFIAAQDRQVLKCDDLENSLEQLSASSHFQDLLLALIDAQAFSAELGQEFALAGAISGLSACRQLRSCLNASLSQFLGLLSELISAFDVATGLE